MSSKCFGGLFKLCLKIWTLFLNINLNRKLRVQYLNTYSRIYSYLIISAQQFVLNSLSTKLSYFTQAEVLDRVPYAFLLMAAIYAVLEAFGLSLLLVPTP